jgi:hypothetical protein
MGDGSGSIASQINDKLDLLDLADKDISSSDVADGEENGVSTLSYIDTIN